MGVPQPASPRTAYNMNASILRLRNNAGEAFDVFLNDFEKFVDDALENILTADASNILVRQGQAQMAKKLYQMMRDTK